MRYHSAAGWKVSRFKTAIVIGVREHSASSRVSHRSQLYYTPVYIKIQEFVTNFLSSRGDLRALNATIPGSKSKRRLGFGGDARVGTEQKKFFLLKHALYIVICARSARSRFYVQ